MNRSTSSAIEKYYSAIYMPPQKIDSVKVRQQGQTITYKFDLNKHIVPESILSRMIRNEHSDYYYRENNEFVLGEKDEDEFLSYVYDKIAYDRLIDRKDLYPLYKKYNLEFMMTDEPVMPQQVSQQVLQQASQQSSWSCALL